VVTILVSWLIVPLLPYMLSFAAGAMINVIIAELIPEMSEGLHTDAGTVAFALGFTLMLAMDVALG
jgi:ZIP family zinc transporter